MTKRIAVAPGDPAGIGYEITAKALLEKESLIRENIVVVYAQKALWRRALSLYAPNLEVVEIASARDAREAGVCHFIDVHPGFDVGGFVPGKVQADCARVAFYALERIIRDVQDGWIDGICTGPIHKVAMRAAGVEDIGHTEILAHGFGVRDPMTLFIVRGLRIFFYTRHLSLRQALDAVTEEGVYAFGLRMNREMKQIGFEYPHLALAALNPHAGDGGQFGMEEESILKPAVERLRADGVDISEPIGADSVFAQAARGRYDAVLSLYHDQGHIAAKTYDFERTISATLGLPCLRTSVDHGTAFDIAWQGKAQSVSMGTALETLVSYL